MTGALPGGRGVGAAQVGRLGSILGVWAHPDDEAYLTAGVMMRAVEAGHRVMCVTATKGEAGFPADDRRSLAERAEVREIEMARSLALLGVTEHRWLGYPDGACAQVPDQRAVDVLAGIIEEFRPDTVITFAPDGMTGHPDHIAACRWTTGAVQNAAPGPQLLYATMTHRTRDTFFQGIDPALVMMVDGLLTESVDEHAVAFSLTCDEPLLARKIAALRAQASQIEPLVAALGMPAFADINRDEIFRRPLPSDPEFIERCRTLSSR